MALEVLTKQPSELELSQFATLHAIKGKQFGRDIYSTVIKFDDLDKFLSSFPEVQRNINTRKVTSMKSYILSGLESGENMLRFFSAITVTCRGHIFYDDNLKRIAIDIHQSKLSINDGQHRCQSVVETLKFLEKEFVKTKNKEKLVKLHRFIGELKEMTVPVVIFDGLKETEERQLFVDLNNLAQKPSKNTNILLDQKDFIARISRELAIENRYLKHYGVEFDKMQIKFPNTNTFLLSTIYAGVKELLRTDLVANKNFLNEENYALFKEPINVLFDALFLKLPGDINTRGKYLIDKVYGLKAICRFIHDARKLDMNLTDEQIVDVIARVNWENDYEYWKQYGGLINNKGILIFGGSTAGLDSIYNCLIDIAERTYLNPTLVLKHG